MARDETTPLLAADSPRAETSAEALRASKKLLILIAASTLCLLADFGFFLSAAPQTAVFERIICHNYYPDLNSTAIVGSGGETNMICKSEAVQSELALINGWKDTFDMIPGILLAVPYGLLADRWGRKPVILLSIVGIILAEIWLRFVCYFSGVLPLRLVWLAALFKFIGGGDIVLSSTCLVMVADIFSEEERLTALFRLSGTVILSEIVATPLSAYVMTVDPLFAYFLGLFMVIVGCLPALLLPETLDDAKERLSQSMVAAEEDDDAGPELLSKRTPVQTVVRQIRKFVESTRCIWQNTSVMLALFAFFVTTISRQSTNLLIQYASIKFHWSIARSSLLVSLRGIMTLVQFFVVMPCLSYILAEYLHLDAKLKDLRLSEGSGFLSVVGFLVMSLAGTPVWLCLGLVLLSLGSAFGVTSRSFVTSLVLPDHVGTLYSAAAVVQSVGALVAGPLLAYLFRLGLHLGGAWLGLPFLQAAVLFLLAFIAISCIRVEPPALHDPGTSQESEEPLRHEDQSA